MLNRLQESIPLSELIRQELLPFHGRLAGSLRTTLAACIAILLAMTFRTPAAAPGIYLVFLVSYETPYLTFTSGLFSLVFQCVGVASTLLLIIATGNAPMAHVLGLALFSFIAAYLLRTMRRRGAMDFGVFSITSLALWDQHLPAQTLVAQSMWPVATGAIGVFTAVAVEYALARRDPFYAVHQEFVMRAQTLESFFRALDDSSESGKLSTSAKEVVRLSLAGQGRMLSLLEEIAARREGAAAYVEEYPVLLPHLFHLLDLAARLTLVRKELLSAADRAAAAQMAEFCAALADRHFQQGIAAPEPVSEASAIFPQLLQSAAALAQLQLRSPVAWQPAARGAKKTPSWFAPDMWSNPAHLFYSLKISFCATLCYVLYSAMSWPGISTAVLTVLIVGLNHTGAISQKLIFRMIGAAIGCLILGIGAMVFLFPMMDTIASFILLMGGVVFLCSWIARSPHIGYIGMQMAFSFFVIAFERFSAPTALTPARDRILGIALALLVVWIVFLEINPVSTCDQMRQALAQALRGLESLPNAAGHGRNPQHEQIVKQLTAVHALSEMLVYEIGSRREQHLRQGQLLVEAATSAGDFFLALGESGASKYAASWQDELHSWSGYLLHPASQAQLALSVHDPAEHMPHATKAVHSFAQLRQSLSEYFQMEEQAEAGYVKPGPQSI